MEKISYQFELDKTANWTTENVRNGPEIWLNSSGTSRRENGVFFIKIAPLPSFLKILLASK